MPTRPWLLALQNYVCELGRSMKYLVLAVVLALNSCNTLIGMGRDGKQAYTWTKDKIQGDAANGNQPAGAPVY